MTPDKAANIQNEFFNRARRDGGPVTIYLTNGKKLTGRLRAFDKFTLLVESNRVEQVIFKHAISTVAVGRPGAAGRPPGGRPARPGSEPPRPMPVRPPSRELPGAPPEAAPHSDESEPPPQ